MMPQPPVHTANGGAARLDDVIKPGFASIAQKEETAAAMAALRDRLWPALQPTLVAICADPSPKNLPPILPKISILVPEPSPALVAALRAHRDQIILVRPDRYVAAAFWHDDAEATIEAFNRLCWKSSENTASAAALNAPKTP